jgi:hypothetical protein
MATTQRNVTINGCFRGIYGLGGIRCAYVKPYYYTAEHGRPVYMKGYINIS